MNHTLSGGIPKNIVITAGYDREEVVANITLDMTLRELKMLESALHRHWTEITDDYGRAVNCEQLDADATYSWWRKIEMLNEAIKSDIKRLYYDNFAKEIVTKKEPTAPPERYVELSQSMLKAIQKYMKDKNDE